MRALLLELPLPMLLTLMAFEIMIETAPCGMGVTARSFAAGGSRSVDLFLPVRLVFADQEGAPR